MQITPLAAISVGAASKARAKESTGLPVAPNRQQAASDRNSSHLLCSPVILNTTVPLLRPYSTLQGRPMTFRRVAQLLLVVLLAAPQARADVVVISNRALVEVAVSVWPLDADGEPMAESPRSAVLPPGDLAAFPCDGPSQMAFRTQQQQGAYTLDPTSAYFFAPGFNNKLELQKIGLTPDPKAAPTTGTGVIGSEQFDKIAEVRVKLLVDENEAAARSVWEERLRSRLDAASDVLEKHCRVRLKVVMVGRWHSDEQLTLFSDSLREFEREVSPAPARLAIGFTSQYGERVRGSHLGGTRGPLHPYILVREASQGLSEPERLEVLLHELGHFLGAVHSPEIDSVMRPQLGDQRALSALFRVGYDPVNTLAMNLFADELRARNVADVGGLTAPTRSRLQQIYTALAKAMPDDPAPRQYLSMIAGGREADPQVAFADEQLARATRQVVKRVVETATQNQQLQPAQLPGPRDAAAPAAEDAAELQLKSVPPVLGPPLIDEPFQSAPRVAVQPRPAPDRNDDAEPAAIELADEAVRLTGDALTEQLVRSAARAAAELPDEQRAAAFLLGLGIAMDDMNLLIRNPQTRGFCQIVESAAEREHRLDVLGSPTIRGRPDLAKHFFFSMFLTQSIGAAAADAAGLSKEMVDSTTGSGFSFIDLAADKAGVAFAEKIAAEPELLASLATDFQLDDYMPPVEDLPEGLSTSDFLQQIGSESDVRFRELTREIRRRIDELPGHRAMGVGR